jgi:hypothetical protein
MRLFGGKKPRKAVAAQGTCEHCGNSIVHISKTGDKPRTVDCSKCGRPIAMGDWSELEGWESS